MTRMLRSVLLRWPPLAVLLATLVGLGTAGPLNDPTRPPATVADRPPPPAPAPGSRPVAAAPAAPASAPAPVLQVQAVQMPSQGAATAMIDGQLLRLGDTIADKVVVGIDREGVVLRGKAGSERLLLLSAESHKRPPGSVVTTRSAGFTPAASPRNTARGATDDRTDTADERPDHADAPTGGKPLSVAERTKP